MSVGRCKWEVSSSEFVRWMILFDEELEERPPALWLLIAQLTYWVYRLQFVLGGTPNKTIEDFLPQPEGKVRKPEPVRRQPEPEGPPPPPTYDPPPPEPQPEVPKDQRLANSKSAWASFMEGQKIMKAPPPPGGVIPR